MEEILDDNMLEKLKDEDNELRKKIIDVEGEWKMKGMGLSKEERKRIVENVNIVLNVEDNVRLKERM